MTRDARAHYVNVRGVWVVDVCGAQGRDRRWLSFGLTIMTFVTRLTRVGVVVAACTFVLALALRSPWARGAFDGVAADAAAARLSGTIRDASRRPIAGATVCATCTTCTARIPAVACAISDRAGRYAIAELVPGRHWIAASAEGYTARESGAALLAEPSAGRTLDLELTPGGARVAGAVRNASGAKLAHARVRITHADPPRFTLEVTADAEGAFALAMPSGPFEIVAQATGYAPAAGYGVAPAQRVQLTLEPSFQLRGRVVHASSGEGVAGVEVRAVPRDRMPRLTWAQTDASGRFAFDQLAAGSYLIIASGAGVYGELPRSVELGALGEVANEIAIEGHPAFELTGRVATEEGAPCPEGFVLLGEPSPGQASTGEHAGARAIGPEQHAIIDRHGVVRFGGVPPARYFASIHCPGYVLKRGPDELELPRDGDREQVWTIEPATRLVARASDAQRRPIANARIAISWLGRDDRRVIMPALTGADGTAVITGPRCGDCQLLAADNIGAGRSVPFVLSEDGARGEATLVLEGDAALELDVRDHRGAPIDGLQVLAERADGEPAVSRYVATALGDGRYRFAAIAPGPYLITGEDSLNPAQPLWGTPAMPVEVAAGAALQWRAVMSRNAAFTGRVLDEAGNPERGVWVSALPELEPGVRPLASMMNGALRRVATDDDGRFVLDGLVPSARFRLRALRAQGSALLLEPRTPQEGLQLTLPRPARVRVLVRDARGAALPQLTLRAHALASELPVDRLIAEADGEALWELPPGPVELTAIAPDGETASQRLELDAGGSHEVVLRIGG